MKSWKEYETAGKGKIKKEKTVLDRRLYSIVIIILHVARRK